MENPVARGIVNHFGFPTSLISAYSSPLMQMKVCTSRSSSYKLESTVAADEGVRVEVDDKVGVVGVASSKTGGEGSAEDNCLRLCPFGISAITVDNYVVELWNWQ